MRIKHTCYAVACASALSLTGTALAQDAAGTGAAGAPHRTGAAGAGVNVSTEATQAGHVLASAVRGTAVRNLQDDNIGNIDDLIINASDGRVEYAVIGVGGFLGIGQRDVAVPWDSFQVAREDDTVHYRLDVTRDRLEQAPEFDRTQADTQTRDTQWQDRTRTHWGTTDRRGAAGTTGAGATPGAGMTPGAATTPRAGMTPGEGMTPGAAMTPSAGATPGAGDASPTGAPGAGAGTGGAGAGGAYPAGE